MGLVGGDVDATTYKKKKKLKMTENIWSQKEINS